MNEARIDQLILRQFLSAIELEIFQKVAQEENNREQATPVVFTNSIGMKFALIPAGKFLMGSSDSEANRADDEGPRHEVLISRPFYLGVYPVTQREYQAVMGVNPSAFHQFNDGGPDHPVETVSWDEASEFCRLLSERPEEAHSGRVYRLPTEAEWEYACRGGVTAPFHFGKALSSQEANFNGKHPYGGAAKGPNLRKTTKVGSYPGNAFGLHDMHGNVWEWCQDWFDENYYNVSPKQDPQGPPDGTQRVIRGGSFDVPAASCRSACRDGNEPDCRICVFGFRVVAVAGRT